MTDADAAADAAAVPEVAAVADADAPAVPESLVARARALAARDGRALLGIAGAPGAGKSTLAARLVAQWGEGAVVVPMDGFHLAQGELERLGRAARKGAPDTFDSAGFVALLRRLRESGAGQAREARGGEAREVGADDDGRTGAVVVGETVSAPEHHRDLHHAVAVGETVWAPEYRRDLHHAVAGAIAVGPEVRLIVVEGNYLLCDEAGFASVRGLLDEVWFCELDTEVRIERLVARHVASGKEPGAARAWVLGSDERNAELVAASRGRADVVVPMS